MGKRKGGVFENRILDNLRKEFGYDSVHKTKGSGNTKDDKGDLVFMRKYLIECKHYKKLSWRDLDNFWIKIRDEAKHMNKVPIIIYRENRQPIMVMCLVIINENLVRVQTLYNLWKQTICKFELFNDKHN